MEKVRMLKWINMKDILLTNAEMQRRGMALTPDCPRCDEEETTSHLFREFLFAKECWYHCM